MIKIQNAGNKENIPEALERKKLGVRNHNVIRFNNTRARNQHHQNSGRK